MTHTLNANWLNRFAARVIQMNPATMPLEAVRSATLTFPEAGDLDPEVAAAFFVAHGTVREDGAEMARAGYGSARRAS